MGSLSKVAGIAVLLLAVFVLACRHASPHEGAPLATVDTGIAHLLSLGGTKQISGATDEALRLFMAAHQRAEKESLFQQLGEAKIRIGEVLYDRGSYDSALTWFRQAMEIAVVHHLRQVRAYAQYYIGKYNETKGAFGVATKYYDSSLAISREDNDSSLLALALISRGKNYISEGRLNFALQNYLEAFQLSEGLHDSLLYALTCSHLGSLYILLDQYDKALDYSRKGLAFRGDMNNPEGIAKSCNNVGIVFHKLKQPDSAFHYFFLALDLCRHTHYQKGMVKAMTNIGNLYCEQNREDKAARYLDTAYIISTRTGYGSGIAATSLNLANHLRKKGQVSKAIYYYRLSLSKLDKTDYDEMLESIYQGLFDCYDSIGDDHTALQYHVLLLQTQKKLLNVENARQLAELTISFDLERKEKDNQVLRADNELKEALIKRKTILMWLIVIALGFTIVLCLHVYNRLYVKKKANRQLETLNGTITDQNGALAQLNKELEVANREKDKLFSIISHELRNPLYWFQNLSEVLSKKFREMPPEKVQKSLSALDESAKHSFHLMDNLLQWSRSKLKRVHPRKGEHDLRRLVCDAAEMYQTILRHKDIGFRNTIPGELLIYADADLFYCVIRNLLSNAIKYTPSSGNISVGHSIGDETEQSIGEDGGHSSVEDMGRSSGARAPDEMVTVVVADSGTGIPYADVNSVFSGNIVSMDGLMQEKGSGLGLRLCKDFVELNGGTIWVESSPGLGTKFFFTVPLIGRSVAHTPPQPVRLTKM